MISRIGSYERILQNIKRRQISWFGHMSRHDILTNSMLHGRFEGMRKRGGPTMNWMEDVYEFTSMSIEGIPYT